MTTAPPRAARRKLIFSIVWVVIGSIVAATLVKLAFFSGTSEADAMVPTGTLETPTVTVDRSTVVNSFTIQGSVSADAGVPIRATEQGTITDVFVKNGDKVNRGQVLFDVREQIGQTNPEAPVSDDPDKPAPPAPSPEPIYQYHSITAPADGVISGFNVLIKQNVTIGEEVGQIGPGTFTVVADLTAAMQYRMLNQPSTAKVTISGGPAPFECSNVQIGAPPSADPKKPAASDQPADPSAGSTNPDASKVTGQVRCAVPADQSVFAGLNASIEVVAGTASDVLVVPVTAVKGDYATGIVYTPNPAGGPPLEVRVELGLTDGTFIEVKSGLEQGQTILQYVPSEVPVAKPDGMGGFGPEVVIEENGSEPAAPEEGQGVEEQGGEG
ncbi:biotin/lipoyl-binding protein [Gulosibacter macacae]|uniref:Biotin/lipoyl-binding protein n=1 Tax=Gulosibacter macacae TaxID=2488791 RepID=A0A3P3VZN6_9MICO|nr:biotin/lipoyl-binding protein [Gulosibacter macacae]RRJ87548.1 biotin/lipoyl-binding protein [Gulosibacter macacae]